MLLGVGPVDRFASIHLRKNAAFYCFFFFQPLLFDDFLQLALNIVTSKGDSESSN